MRKRVLGWTLALAGLTFLGGTLWASDDPGPTATLNFVIVKDYNGKPVHNAAVIMHSVSDKGKQEKGGLELKTDEDGKASYDGIPYGKSWPKDCKPMGRITKLTSPQ